MDEPAAPATPPDSEPKAQAMPVGDPVTARETDSPVVPPAGWRPPEKGKYSVALIVAVALLAVVVILYAWRLPPFAGRSASTDNAYVRGQVTIISPQVSGYVVAVPVQDFAEVKAGQLLAKIDDRIYRARVAQAQANVEAQQAALANSAQTQRSREAATLSQDAAIATARAQLARAAADMRRASTLVADGSISARERDQTRATLLASQAAVRQAEAGRAIGTQDIRTVVVGRSGLEASVEAAKAQLRLAQIDLENTEIRAPVGGQLSEIGVRNGAYVTPGTQLLFLVPHNVWVIANFKEEQTHGMHIGQPAIFRVDALGNAKLHGRVVNLSPAAGSEFSVIKSDNATGNFVKVAQRIAVRIDLDQRQELAQRLRPGMSVDVSVDTREGAGK